MNKKIEIATFANGCFWCTEAIFKRLKGVISIKPGYSGGSVENPSWEDVCSGKTGHAESIQIQFNPTHDPTTLNQQGNDMGTEYRSAIFYHDDKQREEAQDLKAKIEKEKIYKDPIVTEITQFANFYEAENYHKDYYDKNKDYPYCRFVIDPKLKKLLEKYLSDVKEEYKN